MCLKARVMFSMAGTNLFLPPASIMIAFYIMNSYRVYKHRGRGPPRNQKLRATFSPSPLAHVSDISTKLHCSYRVYYQESPGDCNEVLGQSADNLLEHRFRPGLERATVSFNLFRTPGYIQLHDYRIMVRKLETKIR